MQIFSMDTSSAAASCALLEDDRPIAQFYTDARLTHSQTIMPMAQALLECSHKSVPGHRPVCRLGGARLVHRPAHRRRRRQGDGPGAAKALCAGLRAGGTCL